MRKNQTKKNRLPEKLNDTWFFINWIELNGARVTRFSDARAHTHMPRNKLTFFYWHLNDLLAKITKQRQVVDFIVTRHPIRELPLHASCYCLKGGVERGRAWKWSFVNLIKMDFTHFALLHIERCDGMYVQHKDPPLKMKSVELNRIQIQVLLFIW